MKRGSLWLAFFLFMLIIPSAQTGAAQQLNPPVDQALGKELDYISQSFKISFVYEAGVINSVPLKNYIRTHSRNLEEVLSRLLTPLHLVFIKISEKQYIIKASPDAPTINDRDGIYNTTLSVKDSVTGKPLYNVNVKVNNVTGSHVTDQDGKITIRVNKLSRISIYAPGYYTKALQASALNSTVFLTSINIALSEVTVLGSRAGMPRTKIQTVLPVDIYTQPTLALSGQLDIGQMLHYTSSSFNSSRYGINNVASYTEQSTLRGLGPDQLLVLVNGKRRHSLAAINLNNTVGKGTSGTDLSAIPASLIERIEILRDGAAVQYGSDAIAGIINIVLKKNSGGNFSSQFGQTSKGDGTTTQNSFNYSWPLASDKGFLTVSLNYQFQQATNRARPYNGLVYRANSETQLHAPSTADQLAETKHIDDSLITVRGFNRNQAKYGDAQIKNISAWFNMETPLNAQWHAYTYGGFSNKNEVAYGFYRFPNFYPASSPLFPNGYLPEFPATLLNRSLVAGVKTQPGSGWNIDISASYGYNKLSIDAVNTVNASMGSLSPTRFKTGTTGLSQGVFNIDVSKKLSKDFNIATGIESRIENYGITSGDEASYLDSNTAGDVRKLPGANGRPGFKPDEALNKHRTNIGIYSESNWAIRENVLLSAAARYEQYSDFGSNLSGKLAFRYQFNDALAFRSSLSRNFRAPSLQQIYYQQQQFQFFQKNGQADVYLVQHFNNYSPALQQLNIPKLRPETSINIGAGITGNINQSFTFTADAYLIPIHNRIIVSGRLDSTITALKPILAAAGVTDMEFFLNALNTTTTGIDITGNYHFLFDEEHTLTFNAAASFTKTMIDAKPSAKLFSIPAEKVLPRVNIGIIENAQPKTKVILSGIYHASAFDFLLRNTYFGKVANLEDDPAFDQVFKDKIITDVQVSCRLNKQFTLTSGINNLFNVYPDEIKEVNGLDTNLTYGGQIPYSRTANQFGFNGQSYYFKAVVRF
jgi:iron complex outermembrane receptor protein